MNAQSIKESRGIYLADAAKELVAAASESRFDAATFLEKFESMLHVPGAIQSIRGLVLDLAVTGKLSKQLESDGTAVEQLQLTEGDKSVAEIDNQKRKLPHTWAPVPCRLLLDLETGKRMKGGAKESGVISLGGEHIRPNGTVDYSVPRFVSQEFFEDMKNGHVRVLDTLMVKDGATTGKAAFVESLPENGKAAVNEHVFILRWREPIDKKLGFYFIRAFASSQIASKSSGIIGGIRREAVLDFVFPVPPFAEQQRIVAKVDELMGLCDRLEALEAERKDRHASLSRAALARFAASPTPPNLQLIFHKSFNVEPSELRRTILTVAFHGRFVVTEYNHKLTKATQKHIDSDIPWLLPYGWQWLRLGDVADLKHGYAFSSEYFSEQPSKYVLTTPGNFYEKGGFRDRGVKTKYYSGEVDPAFILDAHDLIIPMTEQAAGLLGSPAFIPNDGKKYLHNQRLGKLVQTVERIIPEYMFWYFNCDFFRNELARTCTGMKVRHTSPKRVLQVPIPICSIAEQKRIVAKVDELMALVDQLEQQLAHSRTLGQQLLEAVVGHLTNATAQTEALT